MMTKRVETVFVFCALMKGHGDHSYLKDSRFVMESKVEGGFDLYNQPFGFTYVVKGTGVVRGEVWEVSSEVLQELDRFKGIGDPHPLHRRIKVDVYLYDQVGCEAWMYVAGPALGRYAKGLKKPLNFKKEND